ncbi:MAG: GMC family oxidoreductase [Candidatus Eremiobacteraeota bacterium]|nr:GMC family oxidoreductase [Candidatus Eremiobacteraeota bacterium]
MNDPVAAGLARGWRVHDASWYDRDVVVDCDVAIVGSGAGGGTAAEILSRAGLHVVLIEEGPLKSSRDFRMRERDAYPQLYQESAGRRTKDKGIVILQGRCVGGSTTVNWTSSFRTPPETLGVWQQRFGLVDYTTSALEPWFAMMERRLNIHPWDLPPNGNNEALRSGAVNLGIPTAVIPRNVTGCRNLGYCGMGCPVNAKQSMLVTTIPAALDRGATLITRLRAQRFVHSGDAVSALVCAALDRTGLVPGPHVVTIRARSFVAAAGSIGTPALLMRSAAPDPYATLGKRTFLHPVVVSAAIMPDIVAPYSGAPQSIYSDHFLHEAALDGPIGYKLEVPPVHPVLMATTTPGFGSGHARLMSQLAHTQVIIALMRDGFHAESIGGSVGLRSDGSPILDYPITQYVWDGMRRALVTMSQIQFAAGAKSVLPIHEAARELHSADDARSLIAQLPMEILRAVVVSAHVMGGCAMGSDPRTSVAASNGRHHSLENLFVFDGSAFPTSIGANPQLSVYATVARNASRLAKAMTGRETEAIA